MSRSEDLFAKAQKHIPGGVNSPVRAFKSVGGTPLFFKHAEGAYVVDEDDKRYVDYVGSWGPMILGHGHPDVLDSVRKQLEHGLSYGAPTAMETDMADLVCSLVPSMEMVRMVSSGTEATMSAIRLARGYTGRDAIIKFEGCYHGHSDSLLVKAGSGLLTQGVPSSAGVPADFAKHTLTLPFNDIAAVEKTLAEVGQTVACIIVEPVAGNMNCVPPAPGFLEGLREQCDKHGVVLIFDEVMTGFRVSLGGAQGHYASSRTCPPSARSSVAACRSAASAANAKSWAASPRSARSTSRHPVGQPAGHGRRPDHPEADQPPGLPRRADRLHQPHA